MAIVGVVIVAAIAGAVIVAAWRDASDPVVRGGSVSFPAKPVSVAPHAPTEIPAAAIGTPAVVCRWCDRPIVQVYDFEVHAEPMERHRLWAHQFGGALGADRFGGIHLAEPA